MSRRHLNLASEQFVNRRPVARVTTALWVLAALVTLVVAVSFWSYFRGQDDQREQLRQVESDSAAERQRIATLGSELAGIDVGRLNERAQYLNQRIAQRTFSWSLLFDRLAELLPGDVRLQSLAPRPLDDGRSRRRAGAGADQPVDERVQLQIQGTVRRDEALLELLDELFADDAFEDPNLSHEARDQGELRFALTVDYLPVVAAGRPEIVEGDAGGDPVAPAAAPATPAPPPRTAPAGAERPPAGAAVEKAPDNATAAATGGRP
jgi:Tfp pilus assembly protein PilN